jgi:DNA-binding Lrp family transcriptional regulator
MIELSEKDKRLIRALQRDARLSNQELAEIAGLSASACWRRVKALEEEGLITGYVAGVDAEKAGLGFGAIVHVTLERHDRAHLDQFIQAAARRPEVLELFATAGDKDAYNHFLEEFLFRLPGIDHVRTNLILREIKATTVVPL